MKRFLSQIGLSLKQWALLLIMLVAVVWVGHGTYYMFLRYIDSKGQYQQSQEELDARKAAKAISKAMWQVSKLNGA